MANILTVQHQISLTAFNSFKLSALADDYIIVENKAQLCQLPHLLLNKQWLVLGGGSNILFFPHYHGCIVHNALLGKSFKRDGEFWYLDVNAGENWHQLVEWSLEQGIAGLENLALIPGTVGAAPVQNIGAYGCDFATYCHSVEVFNLSNGQFETLLNDDCQFAYRNSIFKSPDYRQCIITSVCLKLPVEWVPRLKYGTLGSFDPVIAKPKDIFDQIVATRQQKIPDPIEIGSAGSFFKNPEVTTEVAEKLKEKYPTMPSYAAEKKGFTKLAAGWLIDQCKLKGSIVGGAQVHEQQALVLINKDNASYKDILHLAGLVQKKVFLSFGINLEPEVRIVSPQGLVSFEQALVITA